MDNSQETKKGISDSTEAVTQILYTKQNYFKLAEQKECNQSDSYENSLSQDSDLL